MKINPDHISKKIKFKRKIIQLVTIMFYPLFKIIPRNENIWLFGSCHGTKFAENSKYLYLYVCSKHPEIKAIWTAKKGKVVKELKKEGFKAYKIYSLMGFYYAARARYAITSLGLHDLNKIALSGAINIQLWHGTPLKNIMRNHSSLKEKTRQFLGSREHHVISASKEVKKKFKEIFWVKSENIHITGYPRNDALFCPNWLKQNKREGIKILEEINSEIKFKKIILYLPTWRSKKGEQDLIKKYKFNVKSMDNELKKMNAILIIKAHPVNVGFDIPEVKNSKRIINIPDKKLPDLYPLLSKTDLLITDYSSVYFDFLLLDRPIVFSPFDLDKKRKNSFFYDYYAVTPGPKGKNWIEVMDLAKSELKRDQYKKERKKVNNLFNKYSDGNNSKRVFEVIKKLKNEK